MVVVRGGGVEDYEVFALVGVGVVVRQVRVNRTGAAAQVELLQRLVFYIFTRFGGGGRQGAGLTARITAGLGARFLGT